MNISKALSCAITMPLVLLSAFAQQFHENEAARKTQSNQSPPTEQSLPFTIEQVLAYFTESFGKPPEKISDRYFVFIDRENPDEGAIITVTAIEPNMGVVLMATGDYGVNYIREFFEAPFFLRSESELFYTLLGHKSKLQEVETSRFRVQFGVSESGHWILVGLKFQPSQKHKPDISLSKDSP